MFSFLRFPSIKPARRPLAWLFLLLTGLPWLAQAQCPQSPDYQPLADLHTSTNGPGWRDKTNWLTNCDVGSWYSVSCTNGRVTGIDLPASLSDLTNLQSLGLSTNQLTGVIPAGLATLPALQTLLLAQNRLTGTTPASLVNRSGGASHAECGKPALGCGYAAAAGEHTHAKPGGESA